MVLRARSPKSPTAVGEIPAYKKRRKGEFATVQMLQRGKPSSGVFLRIKTNAIAFVDAAGIKTAKRFVLICHHKVRQSIKQSFARAVILRPPVCN